MESKIDNLKRCDWGPTDPLMQKYHDEEWGVAVHDDRTHFEFLVLEMFQAGLSWMTILRKREAFRKAFVNFDASRVAKFGEKDVARLLGDAGIVRNRMKIEAAVNNAKKFLEVQKEFGTFDRYIWAFTGGKPVANRWKAVREIPAKTELSDRVSADLKGRGFKFVGSTIVYAHLQATGLVNDHVVGCFRHKAVKTAG